MADYIASLAIVAAGMLAFSIVRRIVLHRLRKWSEKTASSIDDFIVRTIEVKIVPIFYLAVFYLALKSLALPAALDRTINVGGAILLTFFVVRLVAAIVSYAIENYSQKKAPAAAGRHGFTGIATIVRVIIWGIGIAFLLDNLGFKISTVLAGLGIGGIAVALAAQTVLGDLFSYFVIFFDRPFEIGDFIIAGDYMGTIEYIGIKTTRVRSLGGEQLVFSNTDLTNSRIRNYKRMERRRVVFRLGVIYQTALKELKEVPGIIKAAIEGVQDTVFDRAHFASYGDSSLDFEAVYYVLSSDYNKYMDTQQEINFRIKDEFEKRAIEFAYPTQTLFIERTENTP
ncbi:MAG: mechanosensitive ion channel [Nitrospiraceae bacterium]|nr:MAG: mechanosensitive ion channel [Nitrospiraceae bacterium]